MSHRPQRTEKDCLNCGAQVMGHYCQNCGQENVVPKESFWAMLVHFVYDITHFDGKFFATLKILLRKPGYLSVEYMKGRRMAYLNPVRMYIFTSAFFFLIFFSLNSSNDFVKLDDGAPFTAAQRDSILQKIDSNDYRDADPVVIERSRKLLRDSSILVRPMDLIGLERDFVAMATLGRKYLTRAEYDSVQNAIPASERDGWFRRVWNKRAIEVNNKYRNDPSMSWEKMGDILLHKLPYLLFVSLPFFALLLKWLYFRRKEFYYADHGIFTIHHYIVSFILLLLVFLWGRLEDVSGWGIWNWLAVITVMAVPFYLYKGMRRFYGQGRGKTIAKFLLLNLSALIVMVFLLVIFVIFSVFTL
jgi:hypothetical protein